jgi:hypothetical protein
VPPLSSTAHVFCSDLPHPRDGRRCRGWGAVKVTTYTRARESVWPKDPPTLSFRTELLAQQLPDTWQQYDPEIQSKSQVTYGSGGLFHIVHENQQRLIDICAKEGVTYTMDHGSRLLQAVEGAIKLAFRKASRQPRVVIPGLYLPGGLGENRNFCVQLLLPLYLDKSDDAPAPNCALPLEWHCERDERGRISWSYSAPTILTIEMAYNNARMLNSVESAWARAAMDKEMTEVPDASLNPPPLPPSPLVSGAEGEGDEQG